MRQEVETYRDVPLAIFMGPQEIREALDGVGDFDTILEQLSDKAIMEATSDYLVNYSTPWEFLESAAKEIVREAYRGTVVSAAWAYESFIDEALEWSDTKSGVLELIERVIRDERDRERSRD